MKLKCYEEDRRVMKLPSHNIVHRNDGSKCDSKSFVMGEKVVFRATLIKLMRGLG